MMMQHSQTQGPNSLEFKVLRSTGNWERQVGLPTNTVSPQDGMGQLGPCYFSGTGKHTDTVDVQKVEHGIIGSFQSGV